MIYLSDLLDRRRTTVPRELDTETGKITSVKFDGLNVIINKGGYKVTEKSRRRIHLPVPVEKLLNGTVGEKIAWNYSDGIITISATSLKIDPLRQTKHYINWDNAEVLIIHNCRYGAFKGNKHKVKKDLPRSCQKELCINYVCWYGTCKKTGDKCTSCRGGK